MTRKYEIVLVLDPDLDEKGMEEQIERVRALIKAHKGEIEREDNTGRQSLSYPMNKKSYGTYVAFVATADNSFVEEFTRQCRINDHVLRFMAVKKDKFAPDFMKKPEEKTARSSKVRSERGEGKIFDSDKDKKSDSTGEEAVDAVEASTSETESQAAAS